MDYQAYELLISNWYVLKRVFDLEFIIRPTLQQKWMRHTSKTKFDWILVPIWAC